MRHEHRHNLVDRLEEALALDRALDDEPEVLLGLLEVAARRLEYYGEEDRRVLTLELPAECFAVVQAGDHEIPTALLKRLLKLFRD